MYLDGQLPGGPPSDNLGGQVSQYAVSSLFGDPKPGPGSPKAGGNPLDQLNNTFFVTPDGGPVVVSPSNATANGIVQYPITQPSTLYPAQVDIEPSGACGLADYAPSLITPGAVPMLPKNQPVAPPQFTDTPSGRFVKPCPGYGADGSLVSLRNDAFRNGLAGCCQSGYQEREDLKIAPDASWGWFLGAAAALMLLTSSPEKKGRR